MGLICNDCALIVLLLASCGGFAMKVETLEDRCAAKVIPASWTGPEVRCIQRNAMSLDPTNPRPRKSQEGLII
eukprot:6473231-Amphidinium_carterae.1